MHKPALPFDHKRLIRLPFRLPFSPSFWLWCVDVPFNPALADCTIMSKLPKSDKPPSFEAALAELEEIVSDMEAGQLPLEKSLAAYKRGAELMKFCQNALQDAQQQVKILEDGVLKHFGAPGQ